MITVLPIVVILGVAVAFCYGCFFLILWHDRRVMNQTYNARWQQEWNKLKTDGVDFGIEILDPNPREE